MEVGAENGGAIEREVVSRHGWGAWRKLRGFYAGDLCLALD